MKGWHLKPMAKATPEKGRFAIFRDGRHVGIATVEGGRPRFKQSGSGGMADSEFEAAAMVLWQRNGKHAMDMVRLEARERERREKLGPLLKTPIALTPAPATDPAASMTKEQVEAQYNATDMAAVSQAVAASQVEMMDRPLSPREIQALQFAFRQGGDGCHVMAFEVRGFGDKLLAMLVGKGFLEAKENPPPAPPNPRLKLTERGINAAVRNERLI